MSNFEWPCLLDLGLATLGLVTFTKAGRNAVKWMFSRAYKPKDSDAKVVKAVVTFAERTAAAQNPERVDMVFLRRQLEAFMLAIVPMMNLSDAQSEYFREIGMKHLRLSLSDAEPERRQQNSVRSIRR